MCGDCTMNILRKELHSLYPFCFRICFVSSLEVVQDEEKQAIDAVNRKRKSEQVICSFQFLVLYHTIRSLLLCLFLDSVRSNCIQHQIKAGENLSLLHSQW